jgi:hypothetical protein
VSTNRSVLLDPADKLAIDAVILDYCRAVDGKDWALFADCFVGDCELRYGELEWRGLEAVVDLFEAAHEPLLQSLHRTLNITVVEAGEGSATVTSYADAILIRDVPGGDTLTVTGFYTDVVQRERERWRIARREFRAAQYSGNLAVMGDEPEKTEKTFSGAVSPPS